MTPATATAEDTGMRHTSKDAGFDEFVHARLDSLLKFGRALTGSEHAAADLVQDALERVLPKWHRVSTENPEGYIRRAMVNRNVSVWRKVRRERLTDVTPDQGHEDTRRDLDLWQALAQLPERQRAVIALRYYEDLSEAEIARVLGCSPGTVKSQSSRGLARLRTLLPPDTPPPDTHPALPHPTEHEGEAR